LDEEVSQDVPPARTDRPTSADLSRADRDVESRKSEDADRSDGEHHPRDYSENDGARFEVTARTRCRTSECFHMRDEARGYTLCERMLHLHHDFRLPSRLRTHQVHGGRPRRYTGDENHSLVVVAIGAA